MTSLLSFPKREQATAAESAKLLKTMLREAFPACKFSVTLSRGTGYGNCSVRWTDGPTPKRVDAIANEFVGKTFDGSDDSTHYCRSVTADGKLTGLGYVSCSRDISPSFARRLSAQVAAYYGVTMPEIIEYAGWNGKPAWKLEADTRAVVAHFYGSDLIYQASQDATRFASHD